MNYFKRSRWFFLLFILFFVFPLIQTGCHEKVEVSKNKTLYQCSMHPKIVSDKPENCPICGMRLTRAEGSSTLTGKKLTVGEKKVLFYRHPMQPEVTSPVPAKDEMGMDYIPVYEEEAERGESIMGRIPVVISPEKQQLIGLKTEALEERELVKTIHAVGKVAYDTALYNALVEFRNAHESHEREKRKSVAILRERADDLLDAARSRVELLGYNEDQMKEFLKAGVHSHAFALKEGEVGITAEIYEYEMGLVRPGQHVRVTTSAYPGKVFAGEIKSLDPILNSETRTLRLRVSVQDPAGELRPEMFVDALLEIPLGLKLALPGSALIRTGEKEVIFVSQDGGRLEPREARTGQEAQGYYELLSGAEAGEKVVISANFLVDSESRFHAALAGFQGNSEGKDGHDHSTH